MFLKPKIQEVIVLSVGGSLIVPNGGIDVKFLRDFNDFIRKHIKKGRKFFIVIGGGQTARNFIDAGKRIVDQMPDEELDWLGIHGTRLNAHLIRTIFRDIAHPRIITKYDRRAFGIKEPVIIGAGWEPGWSTDYDAVLLARDYNASVIINLSNIDYVYNKDPNVYKDAKPIKKTTWQYFETLVGQEWVPGTSAPFDPVASQLAKRHGITVIITNGHKFKNLENILNGESFKGTVITPYKIDATFYDRDYFEGDKSEYAWAYTQSFFGRFLNSLVNLYRAAWIAWVIKPKNCLDVGCGTGLLVKNLRKFGIEAYGIEISQYALDRADKQVKPYLKFGDITKIPYEADTFDVVVTFDVLEHLERSKLRRAIDESVRVSRKYAIHKVFTNENYYLRWFHKNDFSHLSVLSKHFWLKMFQYIDDAVIVRKLLFRLPSFFETIFILRKKTS